MSDSSAYAGTLLPPAVRVAKIVGTVGAASLAGTYLHNTLHTVPTLLSLSNSPFNSLPSTSNASATNTSTSYVQHQQPAALATKIFHRITKSSHSWFRAVILASSGSLGYVGYYLYNYAPAASGERTVEASASATFSSSSFLPHTKVSSHEVGSEAGAGGAEFFGIAGGWMYFFSSSLLILAIVPYTKLLMKPVIHRLNSAGESLEVEEKRKIGLQVVDEAGTWRDLESWKKWNWGRVGLAGTAAVLSGVGVGLRANA